MIPSLVFIELDKSVHDRGSFDCENPQLNDFLRLYAARHRSAGISLTMVLPERDNDTAICAFYTLSHTEIERETLPKAISKKLPFYPVPVLLLAQLAVHKLAQGRGLGKVTLIQALKHCAGINAHLPSFAVIVDAINDDAKSFYEQYGFEVLDKHNGQTRLYLPMKVVTDLFA